MFTSLHDRTETQQEETAERLRFVSSWFRVLGFILVALWVLAGVMFAVTGVSTGEAGYAGIGLVVGIGGAVVGVLLTAPLYFWFSAIASGVAALVDRSNA